MIVESRAETMDKLKVRRIHRVPTGKKRTTEVQMMKVCRCVISTTTTTNAMKLEVYCGLACTLAFRHCCYLYKKR